MNTKITKLATHIKSGSQQDSIKRKVWTLLLPTLDSYISRKATYFFHKLKNLKWKKRLQNAGVPKANEIFTYTSLYELRTLYELASNCPSGAAALEIGSHFGASSCYIAAGLAKVGGHLFCVDTWNNETMPEGEQDTFVQFQKNTAGVKQLITPVRKRSEDIDVSDIKVPLDFVFIDGDHSYVSVKKDFECLQKWLAEDGIIAFHDFSCPYFEGVTRVIGEALASGKWIVISQVESLVWIKPAKWLEVT